jgi:hypothetical protein
MSLALVGVKYKSDKRDQILHHGNWLLKLAAWLVFTALPFLFPNNVVDAYGGCLHAQGDARFRGVLRVLQIRSGAMHLGYQPG